MLCPTTASKTKDERRNISRGKTRVNNNARQVVPVRRWVPDSVSWARLDDAGRVPLERILGPPPSPTAAAAAPTSDTPKSHGGFGDRGIEHHATQSGHRNEQEREPLYLHDWSVPQNLGSDCSLLAGRFEVYIVLGSCSFVDSSDSRRIWIEYTEVDTVAVIPQATNTNMMTRVVCRPYRVFVCCSFGGHGWPLRAFREPLPFLLIRGARMAPYGRQSSPAPHSAPPLSLSLRRYVSTSGPQVLRGRHVAETGWEGISVHR